jgi:membrane-bound lytic murein transglycosylase MltF
MLKRPPMVRLLATLAVAVLLGATARAQSPREKGRLGLNVERLTDKWTGDLDGMMERRIIRILTVYSQTVYFVDNGVPRGTAYDQGKLLEEALNKQRGPKQLPVSIQFVPVSRDELVPWLLDGRGDIANAGLVEILIVDNHKAWFWQRIWPKLRLHPTIAVRTGGEIAWAIRKDSPELKSALNEFLATNGKNSLTAGMIFRRYLLNTQFVRGAMSARLA